MATQGYQSRNGTTDDGKMHPKPHVNIPESFRYKLLSPPTRVIVLGYLLCFTYSLSISVDSRFLSLYYKSKGIDGTTLGMLYSLTPLTTFLTVPIWGMLTSSVSDEKTNGNEDKKSKEMAAKRPFQIIYLNIVIATASQISLAVLDKPIHMMISIVLAGIFQSPLKPMIDGIIMGHMNDRSNFGKFRFFSILGSGFGTNLGGQLLNIVKKSVKNQVVTVPNDNSLWGCVSNLSGFKLLFFARLTLTVLPLLCIRQLQIAATSKIYHGMTPSRDDDKSEMKHTSDLKTFKREKENSRVFDVINHCFRDRNHLIFFLCIYIAGASGGVSDAFSYPRYQESGCSTTHMGQSRLLSSVAGAVMFWYSGRVTKQLGVQNVLVLSMVCAGTRFALLKRMDHPYYIYIIDFIRGTTYGAFWSSSTFYASQIGPPSLRNTILILLNGIYNGIGRSTGAIVGGKYQAVFGTNNLFLFCSWINCAVALVMGVLNYYRRKTNSNNAEPAMAAKKNK
mmetsp:Transcript_11396/g.24157  ORF Transcript_11396/g.24157 Transcript_11396/m.24157 type:complete len:505 (+) Transcript_11396:187-1701(+)